MNKLVIAGLLLTAAAVQAQAQGRKDFGTPPAGGAARPSQASPNQAPRSAADAPADAVHTVTIVNKTTARIHSVNISSSRAEGWGKDLLGSDELDPDSRADVTYNGPCRSDVEIDFEGGAVESRRFVDICKYPTLTIEAGWTLKPLQAAQ